MFQDYEFIHFLEKYLEGELSETELVVVDAIIPEHITQVPPFLDDFIVAHLVYLLLES